MPRNPARLAATSFTAFGVALWALLSPVPVLALELSEVEARYVRDAGPVTVCVDPDWAPYEIIDERGEHDGIAADLLRLAAARAGLTLRLVPTRDWEESTAASREGRCELLSFLNQTPKREEWLVFTDPIFTDPNVIVTREEHPFIADLAGVARETMALPKGTSIEERVRRDFPNLAIVTTESEAEAFALVSHKQADMTLRSLIVAVYTIKKEGWFNLKISGQVPGYENRLRVGVRKDNPILRDVLNKAIATIGSTERAEISNRHVSINVQAAIDYGLLWKMGFVFAVILASNLFWVAKLRTANRRLVVQSRTDILTGLANRADLNAQFRKETERARRYGRPLSVILLDVDHFKAVNDELGHLVGDRVLQELAGVLRSVTRTLDVVGRWGGEEFLVLCPETAEEPALTLARRICAAVRGHGFATGRRQTISAGVATLGPADSIDGLLVRADEALYAAKRRGRDQAATARVEAPPAAEPAMP